MRGAFTMSIRKKDGFKNERQIAFPIKNFPIYLKNPLVNNTYVSEAGYYPKAAHHFRERLDGTDEGILFFCLEGKGTIDIYRQHQWSTYPLKTGDIFCIPPKTPHRYYANEMNPWTILWVHFNAELLDQLPIGTIDTPTMVEAQKQEMIETALVNLFAMEQRNLTLDNAIFMASLLNHLLITIYYFEDNHENKKKNYLLKTTIEFMNHKLHEELTLSELTDKFNISPSYLNAIFKEETGKSPIEFFIKLKMDEACSMLRISKMKITEIASELGYQDAYYFSRLFKKNIGMSPKLYRERHRPITHRF